MKILVTGATGLIGSEVLRQAVLDPRVDEVFAVVRNTPGFDHPKIQYLFHKDFTDYSSLRDPLRQAGAVIWCLGISQTQVTKKQYEAITYDYVIAFAKSCFQYNPSIRFVFVSGDGADRSEKSRTIFKRLKGKAENALLASGLANVIIARPDAVRPRHKNKRAPFVYKLAYPFFPLVEWLAPSKIIWSDVLAKALLNLAFNSARDNTFENPALRKLGS